MLWAFAAGAQTPTPPPQTGIASEALPLEAFLAPPAISLVRLSPSGKSIALVRRVGVLDQVLKLDLPDFKATLLYETHPLASWQVKQKFRERISYLDWKSDDKLVATVMTPVGWDVYDSIEQPIHMVLSADGQTPPVLLNATVTGKVARITPSWIQDLMHDDPNHVMVGVLKGLYRIDLDLVDLGTSRHTRVEVADTNVVEYVTDHHGDVIARVLEHGDGSLTLQSRAVGETRWTKVCDFRRKDQKELDKYEFFGPGELGTLYLAVKPQAPADGDTKAVRAFDIKTKTLGPVVWSNPAYDVDTIIQEKESRKFLAGCYWADTLKCEFSSPRLTANLHGLERYFDNKKSLMVVSQSEDDNAWILRGDGPDDPGTYYFYDVRAHRLQQLGEVKPELPAERLGHMRRMDFKSRDGASLSAYVTEPPGAARPFRPLVVLPHGGPELRDTYSFDTLSQFLVTRGYVVLQPNFRGSGGFGRKFAEAGHGQWGQRMHDDVMDATRALIAEGQVDPNRICIVGGSYGGYEALYSAIAEPKTFRCAVSLDGVTDLAAFLSWQKHFTDDPDRYDHWRQLIGDADPASLIAHSPAHLASSLQTPLLLIHGDADEIVPVEQSRRMKHALDVADRPVHYVEIKGMGHGPSTDEETKRVYGEIESFLATYLTSPKMGKSVEGIASLR